MADNREKLFCKNGGCGAKLGPGSLSRVLSMLPKIPNDNLLVGFDSSDDAAVYKINDNQAFVQTLDFFTPMVDDPYTFGQIAATNALNDIYAMGGTVKTALNIVCFPESFDLNILGKIIQGGADKVSEAGGVLCGGHSINDTDIKYGLSVTGLINPNRILKNNSVKAGDVLILTKPIGVGIINCANIAGLASKDAVEAATKNMTTLNKSASEAIQRIKDVHACTDITGFGLLGHLNEMMSSNDKENNLFAVVDHNKINYIDKSYEYAKEFLITAAGQRNRNAVGTNVRFDIDDYAIEELLFDPQTAGGLMFAVACYKSKETLHYLRRAGVNAYCFATVYDAEDFEFQDNCKTINEKKLPRIIVK